MIGLLAGMAGMMALAQLKGPVIETLTGVPQAFSAVQAVVTPEVESAKQRNLSHSPVIELAANDLLSARDRGLIGEEAYNTGLSRHGINTDRANLLFQSNRTRLTLPQLIDAVYKGDIDKESYFKMARVLGFTVRNAEIALNNARLITSSTSLVTNLFRGYITRETYYRKMKEQGFRREDADLLYNSELFYPGISDLIRFQVREVYNPEVVQRFGLGEEFPEAILPDAAKVGADRETMERYWKAHWNLPSPTMGYEMLHRLSNEVLDVTGKKYEEMGLKREELETDINLLKNLLKTSDYSKFWRDRLAAISYTPLTRVDLRRLYKQKLVNKDFVIATLMERGHTKSDATLLYKFFKEDIEPEERLLTKAVLLRSFNYGIINEEQFKTEMKKHRFRNEEIKIIIELNRRRLQEKDIKDLIKVYREEFVRGEMNENELRTKLILKELETDKIDIIVLKAKQAKRRAIRMPPLRDLHLFYRNGHITEEEYRTALINSNVNRKFIEFYIIENRPGGVEPT